MIDSDDIDMMQHVYYWYLLIPLFCYVLLWLEKYSDYAEWYWYLPSIDMMTTKAMIWYDIIDDDSVDIMKVIYCVLLWNTMERKGNCWLIHYDMTLTFSESLTTCWRTVLEKRKPMMSTFILLLCDDDWYIIITFHYICNNVWKMMALYLIVYWWLMYSVILVMMYVRYYIMIHDIIQKWYEEEKAWREKWKKYEEKKKKKIYGNDRNEKYKWNQMYKNK